MRKKQTVRRLDTPLRSDPPAVCLVRGLSHPQPCRIHMLWESTAHHSSNCWRQTQLLCSIGLDSQACTLAMRLTTVHMMRLNDTAMHSLYICTWPYCYWEHTGYLLGTYWVLTGYLLGTYIAYTALLGTYWVFRLPTLPYWVLTLSLLLRPWASAFKLVSDTAWSRCLDRHHTCPLSKGMLQLTNILGTATQSVHCITDHKSGVHWLLHLHKSSS